MSTMKHSKYVTCQIVVKINMLYIYIKRITNRNFRFVSFIPLRLFRVVLSVMYLFETNYSL